VHLMLLQAEEGLYMPLRCAAVLLPCPQHCPRAVALHHFTHERYEHPQWLFQQQERSQVAGWGSEASPGGGSCCQRRVADPAHRFVRGGWVGLDPCSCLVLCHGLTVPNKAWQWQASLGCLVALEGLILAAGAASQPGEAVRGPCHLHFPAHVSHDCEVE
jgi:hypothetical protein